MKENGPGFDFEVKYGEGREEAFIHVVLNLPCKSLRFEHKADRKARDTGNVFIEFRQKGRPSGLAVTKAEFYAIEFDEWCWVLLPTPRLKSIVKTYLKRHPEAKRMGGDRNLYEGAILPLVELVRLAREALD